MDYPRLMAAFVAQLTNDQKKTAEARGQDAENILVSCVTGRKFDKIILHLPPNEPEVRYFVDKISGIIYGAKSKNAPNERWYFGTLETAPLWEWGDIHAVPVNDTSVRAVKKYNAYITYMPI